MKKLILALVISTTSSAFAQNFFGSEYQSYLVASTQKHSTAVNNESLAQQIVDIIDRDDAVHLERLIHQEPNIKNISIGSDLCNVDDCIPSFYAAWKKKKQTLKVLVRHGAKLSQDGGMPGEGPISTDSLAEELMKQIRSEIEQEKKFDQKKTATSLISPKDSPNFVLNLVKENDAIALDQYLIQYPESISFVSHNWSLIQWACENEHHRPNAVKVLLRHGADSSLPHEDDEQAGQGLDEPSADNLCPELIQKIQAELKKEI